MLFEIETCLQVKTMKTLLSSCVVDLCLSCSLFPASYLINFVSRFCVTDTLVGLTTLSGVLVALQSPWQKV